MNNKLLYTGMLALVLCTTSCHDWLDLPSESKYDITTTFKDVPTAEMAVEGCYSSTFNAEMFYQLGMGTDECYSTEANNNSKNYIGNYVYVASSITPSGTYTAMYSAIEKANMCIKYIPSISTSSASDEKKKNMLLGEAYAMRGMCYLNLIRFYGDVPYTTVPTEDADGFTSSRVSRDIIYDGSIADLQKAVELLPWQSEGMVEGRERFTKNAALGILARTALYAAGYSLRWDLSTEPYDASTCKLAQRDDQTRIKELYQIAADACKQIIDRGENTLLSSYEQVFRDICESNYNNETMLEFGQYGTNVNSLRIGYSNGQYCHTSSMYGKALPCMLCTPTLYFDFDENDSRRDVTCANFQYSSKNVRQLSGWGDMALGKFRVAWKTEKGTGNATRDMNYPLLRYSDVLLMYAEALNEINNGANDAAVAALKQVRLRAFNGDADKIGTIPTDYDGFKKAIIKERKLELAFEGWRRTDLIRWNVLCETLQETKQRVFDMCNMKGEFANMPTAALYQPTTATTFCDPAVKVDATIGTATEVNNKAAAILLDLKEQYKADLMSKDATLTEAAADVQALTLAQADYKSNYKLVQLNTAISVNTGHKLAMSETWVLELFRGMVGSTAEITSEGKCKVELVPLHQSNIIDVNAGLKYEQHPCY